MFKKIKAFFSNGKVMLVESIVMAVAAAGLLLGGAPLEGIISIIKTVAGAVIAFDAIVTAIAAILGGRKTDAAEK